MGHVPRVKGCGGTIGSVSSEAGDPRGERLHLHQLSLLTPGEQGDAQGLQIRLEKEDRKLQMELFSPGDPGRWLVLKFSNPFGAKRVCRRFFTRESALLLLLVLVRQPGDYLLAE